MTPHRYRAVSPGGKQSGGNLDRKVATGYSTGAGLARSLVAVIVFPVIVANLEPVVVIVLTVLFVLDL